MKPLLLVVVLTALVGCATTSSVQPSTVVTDVEIVEIVQQEPDIPSNAELDAMLRYDLVFLTERSVSNAVALTYDSMGLKIYGPKAKIDEVEELANTVVNYCRTWGYWGYALSVYHEDGKSLNDTLSDALESIKDDNIEYHVRVEMERMIRDVYRQNYSHFEDAKYVFRNCMEYNGLFYYEA